MTQRLVVFLDPCAQVHVTEIWSEHWRTHWGCSAPHPKRIIQAAAGKYREGARQPGRHWLWGSLTTGNLSGEMGCLASSLGYVFSLLLCPYRVKFIFSGRKVYLTQGIICIFVWLV